MKDYLKLIRIPNLLMLACIMALFFYLVLVPLVGQYGLCIPHQHILFTLSVVAAVFSAAGGYVVNDYFDTKIDEINHPYRVIVGHSKTRAEAGLYFQILFAIGTLAGIAAAVFEKDLILGFIFVTVPGLLWFYSSSYKRQLIIGNIIVSLCTFLAIFVLGYGVHVALQNEYSELAAINPQAYEYMQLIVTDIYRWTLGFAIFAFLLTWIREIVKDMQDIYGDRELECRTMPIVWGFTASKVVCSILALLCAVLMGLAVNNLPFANDAWSPRYFSYVMLPLLIVFVCGLWMAKKTREFGYLSLLLKIIMLLGSTYAVIAFLLFTQKI